MKKTLFILSNLLIGNLILALFVSSSFFLKSLMISFTMYYHICFSVLVISTSFIFLNKAKIKNRRLNHFFFGFLTSFMPVAITTILLVGYPFVFDSSSDTQTFETIIFSLRFSLLVIFTTGAIYWIPFGILNTFYMRKNCINNVL